MSQTYMELRDQLLSDLQEATVSAAVNVVLSNEQSDALSAELRNAGVIVLDVNAYPDSDELLRDWLRQLLNGDERFGDVAAMSSEKLQKIIGGLLGLATKNGQPANVAFSHFDGAEHWSAGVLGWLRRQISYRAVRMCLILSEKPLPLITQEPIGSSPLNNVFVIRKVEETV